MHTLTVSILGAANDSTSLELPDEQALPVYVKLKEVLVGTRAARRATRKDSGSTAADGQNGDTGRNGTADTSTDRDR